MALFQNYPYTDMQTLNLDGVIRQEKTNTEAIAAETAARESADATLQQNINNEAAARQAADTAEAAARDAADADLQQQILAIDPQAAGALYPYTPQMFGAVADGVTDDTVSIQNCIDAAHNNGRAVYFPAGVYFINTILFNGDTVGTSHALHCYGGMRLFGDNAELRAGENVNHTMYVYTASDATGYTGAKDVIFENLYFSRGNYNSASTLLNISHTDGVQVVGCRFYGSSIWHQIEVNSSRNVRIQRCTFSALFNAVLNSTECIQFDAAAGSGELGAADNTPCADCVVDACTFINIQNCAIGSHAASTVNGLIISGCLFDNGGTDFERAFINFANTVNVTVDGCVFIGAGTQMPVQATYSASVGCTLKGCKKLASQSTVGCYDFGADQMALFTGSGKTDAVITGMLTNADDRTLTAYPAIKTPAGGGDEYGYALTGAFSTTEAAQLCMTSTGRLLLQGKHNSTVGNVLFALIGDPIGASNIAIIPTLKIGETRMTQYVASASGAPSTDSGLLISTRNSGSGNYGSQLAITNHGMYIRGYNTGTYSAWKTIATY